MWCIHIAAKYLFASPITKKHERKILSNFKPSDLDQLSFVDIFFSLSQPFMTVFLRKPLIIYDAVFFFRGEIKNIYEASKIDLYLCYKLHLIILVQ